MEAVCFERAHPDDMMKMAAPVMEAIKKQVVPDIFSVLEEAVSRYAEYAAALPLNPGGHPQEPFSLFLVNLLILKHCLEQFKTTTHFAKEPLKERGEAKKLLEIITGCAGLFCNIGEPAVRLQISVEAERWIPSRETYCGFLSRKTENAETAPKIEVKVLVSSRADLYPEIATQCLATVLTDKCREALDNPSHPEMGVLLHRLVRREFAAAARINYAVTRCLANAIRTAIERLLFEAKASGKAAEPPHVAALLGMLLSAAFRNRWDLEKNSEAGKSIVLVEARVCLVWPNAFADLREEALVSWPATRLDFNMMALLGSLKYHGMVAYHEEQGFEETKNKGGELIKIVELVHPERFMIRDSELWKQHAEAVKKAGRAGKPESRSEEMISEGPVSSFITLAESAGSGLYSAHRAAGMLGPQEGGFFHTVPNSSLSQHEMAFHRTLKEYGLPMEDQAREFAITAGHNTDSNLMNKKHRHLTGGPDETGAAASKDESAKDLAAAFEEDAQRLARGLLGMFLLLFKPLMPVWKLWRRLLAERLPAPAAKYFKPKRGRPKGSKNRPKPNSAPKAKKPRVEISAPSPAPSGAEPGAASVEKPAQAEKPKNKAEAAKSSSGNSAPEGTPKTETKAPAENPESQKENVPASSETCKEQKEGCASQASVPPASEKAGQTPKQKKEKQSSGSAQKKKTEAKAEANPPASSAKSQKPATGAEKANKQAPKKEKEAPKKQAAQNEKQPSNKKVTTKNLTAASSKSSNSSQAKCKAQDKNTGEANSKPLPNPVNKGARKKNPQRPDAPKSDSSSGKKK